MKFAQEEFRALATNETKISGGERPCVRFGPAGMGRPKPIVQAFVVPALAKNARTGHPRFRMGQSRDERVGHPPDGNRVRKTGCANMYFWRNTGGDTLEEAANGSLQYEYIFFNGKRIARRDVASPNTVHYFYTDHLGSTSIVSNATGALPLESESDYFPYGGEIVVTTPSIQDQNYKFTGKERDSQDGLDYFGARYYSPAFGKFLQADEPLADQRTIDPQSWNLYSYVENTPLNSLDPDGRMHCEYTAAGVMHCIPDRAWKDIQDAQEAWRELLMRRIEGINPEGEKILAFYATGAITNRTIGAVAGLFGKAAQGAVDIADAELTTAEREVAEELQAAGHEVKAIPRGAGKTADFLVDGVETELKTVTKLGPNTIKNAIEAAAEQGKQILVDARGTSLTRHEALQQIWRAEGNVGGLEGRVTIWTKDGPVSN